MWGMTAMKKGTAMKDKKKRAGGGPPPPPSTGTYPTVSGAGDIGCMSMALNPAASLLHASVMMRESLDAGGFLQITDPLGNPLNNPGAPEVEIADFVATVRQSETPINGGINGAPMQPGVIHTQNAPANGDVQLIFMMQNDNSTGAFGGGEFVDITMVSNPNNVVIRRINGAPPAQVAFNRGQGMADILFDPLNGGETIILEFKITGHAKAGNFSSATTNAGVGALKTGSCYVQVVFN